MMISREKYEYPYLRHHPGLNDRQLPSCPMCWLAFGSWSQSLEDIEKPLEVPGSTTRRSRNPRTGTSVSRRRIEFGAESSRDSIEVRWVD